MSNLIIDLHGTNRSVLENIGRDFDADIERLEESTKIDSVIYNRMNEGYDGFIIVTSDVKGAQKYFENRYNNVDIAVCSPDGRMQLREVGGVQTSAPAAGAATTAASSQQAAQPKQQATPKVQQPQASRNAMGQNPVPIPSEIINSIKNVYVYELNINPLFLKENNGAKIIKEVTQAIKSNISKKNIFTHVIFHRNIQKKQPFQLTSVLSIIDILQGSDSISKEFLNIALLDKVGKQYVHVEDDDTKDINTYYYYNSSDDKKQPVNVKVFRKPTYSYTNNNIYDEAIKVIQETNELSKKQGDMKQALADKDTQKFLEELNKKNQGTHKVACIGPYLKFMDTDMKIATKPRANSYDDYVKRTDTIIDGLKALKAMTIGNQFDKLGQDVKNDTIAGVFIAAAEEGKKFYDKHKNDLKKGAEDISDEKENKDIKWIASKNAKKFAEVVGIY